MSIWNFFGSAQAALSEAELTTSVDEANTMLVSKELIAAALMNPQLMGFVMMLGAYSTHKAVDFGLNALSALYRKIVEASGYRMANPNDEANKPEAGWFKTMTVGSVKGLFNLGSWTVGKTLRLGTDLAGGLFLGSLLQKPIVQRWVALTFYPWMQRFPALIDWANNIQSDPEKLADIASYFDGELPAELTGQFASNMEHAWGQMSQTVAERVNGALMQASLALADTQSVLAETPAFLQAQYAALETSSLGTAVQSFYNAPAETGYAACEYTVKASLGLYFNGLHMMTSEALKSALTHFGGDTAELIIKSGVGKMALNGAAHLGSAVEAAAGLYLLYKMTKGFGNLAYSVAESHLRKGTNINLRIEGNEAAPRPQPLGHA